MLPYPSNFWLSITWNASAPRRLTLTNASLPIDAGNGSIDPDFAGFNDVEGFPVMGPYLSYIPGLSLDLSGLPRLWNISASVPAAAAAATTSGSAAAAAGSGLNSVLLELGPDGVTPVGPVMHWLELDHSGDGGGTDLYERALLLWPAARLKDNTTYIVAFRNLLDDDGLPIAPSDGFAALKSGAPTNNPALEGLRPRYAALFSTLAAYGWPQTSLTLAYDFTTNTQRDITSRFLAMRDDAFERIAALEGGVPYNITSVQDSPAGKPNVSRLVKGQFFVPTYLNDRAIPSLNSRLVLNATSGAPEFQAWVPFDFEVVIPINAGVAAPAKVVQYGHGLFGDCSEVETGYLSAEGAQYNYVYIAVDWIGLSQWDEATAAVMLATSFDNFAIIPDRLHQGMLNALVAMRLMTQSTAFAADPALAVNGRFVASLNPNDWHYTGNSQGGIMGAVYMATSLDVSRGVLGVPGAPYALLLPRSTDFATLFDVLKIRFPRSIDRMGCLALIQGIWDRMDGSGWASYIPTGLPASPAAGANGVATPPHRAIWQHGLGDAQVTWLGAHAVALSAGAVIFESNVREGNETLGQFTAVPDSAVLSGPGQCAIVGFDFGFPLVPFVNLPPTDGFDAHECVRRTPQAQAQMHTFFTEGSIVNTCGGPCAVQPPDGCGH